MAKLIQKVANYKPEIGLLYLTKINEKVKAIQKFQNSSYMFSIEDNDNPFSPFAMELVQKYALQHNTRLSKNSTYTIWGSDGRKTHINLTLENK